MSSNPAADKVSPELAPGAPLKLIVQIPCYNEAETLPEVIAGVPRNIPGIDRIETLVIDDGSTDGTAEVAAGLGVDHVVRNTGNLGLARTFERGLDEALARNADIIVNTDGDNQYDGASIADLVRPILDGRAEVVVGDRDTSSNREFSLLKRVLQRAGTRVVQRLSGLAVNDAVSGFRAYSRQAAIQTNVLSSFSYTTETLIQAGRRGLPVISVPVRTNPSTRPSRLSRSILGFVTRQVTTIIRTYVMYSPLRAFGALGAFMMLIGAFPIGRFLYFYFLDGGAGHLQSLILGTMFFILGYVTLVIAILSDVIASNRRLLEKTLERVKRMEHSNGGDPEV